MTDRFDSMSLEEMLAALRADGWAVAVHNDYMQPEYAHTIDADTREPITIILDKTKMTFWMFTHECGIFVKGEAPTDRGAVLICAIAAHGVLE